MLTTETTELNLFFRAKMVRAFKNKTSIKL